MESVQICCQSPDSSSCLSTRNLAFARMNLKPLKPAVLMNVVFDWVTCFCLFEVFRFQDLVGLELPIKHTLRVSWAICVASAKPSKLLSVYPGPHSP